MSTILESVIGEQRRAECERNDDALRHGLPIHGGQGIPRPRAALSRTTVMYARLAVVKLCLCCAVLGFAAGQLVVPTSRPMPHITLDKNDVHKVPHDVPAQPEPRTRQRVEV